MRRRRNWWLIAWPGLPHLWVRGSWAGLALSGGFAALASVLMLSSLVWTAWLPQGVQVVGIALAFVTWVGSALVAFRSQIVPEPSQTEGRERRTSGERGETAENDTLFRRAQTQYLQGDWVAAERTLEQLLDQNGRDVEARLLLATLCRHRNRVEEATEHLSRVERLEKAAHWAFEIAAEHGRLARARKVTASTSSLDRTERLAESVSFSHSVVENRPANHLRTSDGGLPTRPDADTIGRIDAA